MLQSLTIENLILIERAEIKLDRGLNIFTGETGAGKSAILTAIRLLCGERAELEWIRKGASSAVVEAILETASEDSPLRSPEGVVLPAPGHSFSIRREIHRSGKSRAFIEDQLVSLSALREWMQTKIEILDQKTAFSLCTMQEQRRLLDAFGALQESVRELAQCVEEGRRARQALEKFRAEAMRRERDLDWAKNAVQMIAAVSWQKGEEETLNAEHTALCHAQELIEYTGRSAIQLAECREQIVSISRQLEKGARLDPRLESRGQALKTAALELEETASFLQSYAERFDPNPARLAYLEKRMHEIEKLKRRFGASWEEVDLQRQKFCSEAESLESSAETDRALESAVFILEEKAQTLAASLSERRKSWAPLLSEAVQKELHTLNLPHAQFRIDIQTRPLTEQGIDEIVFLFSANKGHAPAPLADCASGGELARVRLAAEGVLANRDGVECLVFDEIDSNIGGRTAAVLGEKLRQIANRRQLLCVTHFIQVAKLAHAHFCVTKKETENRSATHVAHVSGLVREQEFTRMTGGVSEF